MTIKCEPEEEKQMNDKSSDTISVTYQKHRALRIRHRFPPMHRLFADVPRPPRRARHVKAKARPEMHRGLEFKTDYGVKMMTVEEVGGREVIRKVETIDSFPEAQPVTKEVLEKFITVRRAPRPGAIRIHQGNDVAGDEQGPLYLESSDPFCEHRYLRIVMESNSAKTVCTNCGKTVSAPVSVERQPAKGGAR